MRKRKPQTRAKRDPPNLARLSLEPHIKGAVTVRAYAKAYGELDLTGLSHAGISQTQAVVNGNLTRAEAILMIQAQALDAFYHQRAQRAIKAAYLHYLDHYGRLALKAPAQCRTTLQTLVDVPSPQQATFIRQAHLATQQQLNNNMAPEPRAREVSKKATNELWEDQSYAAEGIRLDCRAARKAGHADPELAPVGHFDRPKNSRR